MDVCCLQDVVGQALRASSSHRTYCFISRVADIGYILMRGKQATWPSQRHLCSSLYGVLRLCVKGAELH